MQAEMSRVLGNADFWGRCSGEGDPPVHYLTSPGLGAMGGAGGFQSGWGWPLTGARLFDRSPPWSEGGFLGAASPPGALRGWGGGGSLIFKD